MPQLLAYIEAWRVHDITAVLAVLADTCTIIESYGPVYHGRDTVEQWMKVWFAKGGSVDDWRVTNFVETGDAQFAEWTFTCTWNEKQNTFDGATAAKLENGVIVYLREYATTAPLYDWQGTWHD